jgi:hypothetical protein
MYTDNVDAVVEAINLVPSVEESISLKNAEIDELCVQLTPKLLETQIKPVASTATIFIPSDDDDIA